MAHADQFKFVGLVRDRFPSYFCRKKILEVGSLDINGSIRDYFSNCDYTGLDLAMGKGVDVVCEGQNYDEPDNTFDMVISCEAMEHNLYWAETMTNMLRLTKPGGLIVMTCASLGRFEHGTTKTNPKDSPFTTEIYLNYYKNLTHLDISRKVDLSSLSNFAFMYNWGTFDLYFVGVK